MAFFKAEDIFRWIDIKKIFQRDEPAAPRANYSDFHMTCASNDGQADEDVIELTRLRYKKQEAVTCLHRLGLQVLIEHDKDAGSARVARRAQIRPIGHFPVWRKFRHDLLDGRFEVVRGYVR